MSVRVYLMPRVIDPRRTLNVNGVTVQMYIPKYMNLIAPGKPASQKGFGEELVCLLIAEVTDAEHAAITANADVRAMPQDLDSQVTAGNRTAIVNALESMNVPAHWIANGQTFRLVLRRLVGMFDLNCNVQGRGFRFLQTALDNPVSSLPQSVRNAMQASANALNLSTGGITGATLVRDALAAIGAQFDSRPVMAAKTLL